MTSLKNYSKHRYLAMLSVLAFIGLSLSALAAKDAVNYVDPFIAFGLQQICSGDTRYEIDTPLFDKETLMLDPKYTKGGTFTITTKNQSPETSTFSPRHSMASRSTDAG